ncbi:MAG: DUF1330 domain-containing protein [Gaiellaceae bacterium]
MSVFVIAERVEILDAAPLQQYLETVSPEIERYGGRYNVVSESVEVLEGEWHPPSLVIFEFPSREQALARWDSDEYAPLKTLRRQAAVYNIVLAEGLE